MLDTALRRALAPSGSKTLDMKFGPSRAAMLLGRSSQALHQAEQDGRLPAPKKHQNGRRYYTVDDLAVIREALNLPSRRRVGDKSITISVQNFKGGVGKSTISKHLADYLALRGYRVLIVDCDSQASLTLMYGLTPGVDFPASETLAGYLSPVSETVTDIKSIIYKTAWPNVDIMPTGIELQELEWTLLSSIMQHQADKNFGISFRSAITQLRPALQSLSHRYDVVIIDPPPALGFLGLNAMIAADMILVPAPARLIDYASTIHFFEMLGEVMGTMDKAGIPLQYDAIKLICSQYNSSKTRDEGKILTLMRNVYGDRLISEPLALSSEISQAANIFRSIYELDSPVGSSDAYQRALENLDFIMGEIEKTLIEIWAKDRKPVARKPKGIEAVVDEPPLPLDNSEVA